MMFEFIFCDISTINCWNHSSGMLLNGWYRYRNRYAKLDDGMITDQHDHHHGEGSSN